MQILVINAGSSSLKYSAYTVFQDNTLVMTDHDQVEHIGTPDIQEPLCSTPEEMESHVSDYIHAFKKIEVQLQTKGIIDKLSDFKVIAHRVVHGGEAFHEPVVIDHDLIHHIEELSHLAPLHNPVNLASIKFIAKHYPMIEQVAVFDTAFHQTLPDYAYRYALPNSLYETHQIRKYGFHGSSHEYILNRYADLNDTLPSECNLISVHLGNGASVCAIEMGESIDTSMGFTPLEGLVMGTRSGDLDAAIPIHLINTLGYSPHEVDDILNHQSGVFGLSGISDMLQLEIQASQNNHAATLALDIYCYRINKIVGSYLSVMDQVDAIVFTGGVGEHSETIREIVINNFSARLHLSLDEDLNEMLAQHSHEGIISSHSSDIDIWVIPTDEERQIAQHAMHLMTAT